MLSLVVAGRAFRADAGGWVLVAAVSGVQACGALQGRRPTVLLAEGTGAGRCCLVLPELLPLCLSPACHPPARPPPQRRLRAMSSEEQAKVTLEEGKRTARWVRVWVNGWVRVLGGLNAACICVFV